MAGELTTTGLRRGLGIIDLDTGGGGPPPGFAWLYDFEGNPLYDADSVRLYGAI